ncbi:extracellular solute-binding protein [Deinococcus sp.]|uniref:extracellular solute-binding protein n=1 Tax=Deinococcus sp. TaxID=47478 RepID=UPI0025EA827E|nr:extracellular solute-binding protein [Deinococcus sp.]
MKIKRLILPMLALTGMLTAQAQEALKLPISQNLTLKIWAPFNANANGAIKNFGEMTLYKMLEGSTGIKVDFEHPPLGSEKERFNLLLASRNYPDIIEYSWFDVPGGPEQMLRQGVIVRLNEAIAKYAPNLTKYLAANPGLRRDISTDDGDIYAFPAIRINPLKEGVTYGPTLRADWLERLKLRPPRSVADWTAVLKAIKTGDPNGNGKPDEIPLSGDSTSASTGIPLTVQGFLSAYNLAPGFYQSAPGKVGYAEITDDYKRFLTQMHQWYAAGLIDPDFMSSTTQQLDAKVLQNRVGAFYGYAGSGMGRYLANAAKQIPGFSLVAAPYAFGQGGKNYMPFHSASRRYQGYGAAISGTNKSIPETVKWLDYQYSPAGRLAVNFGKEGATYTLVNGQPVYTDMITKNPKLSMAQALTYCCRPQFLIGIQDIRYIRQLFSLPQQQSAYQLWRRASFERVLPGVTPSQGDSRKFASIMNDVNTYVAEMTAKFITGAEPLERFDAYAARVKDQGIDEATGIMQRALDRYNARK